MKKLLSINEVADICGVGIKTVKWWVRSRQIPLIKLGPRVIRFEDEEIYRWIESKKMRMDYVSPFE